jgi:hypothetical protein
MATAGRWGEMERATRVIDSHPHLGSGRREEAAPQAVAGGNGEGNEGDRFPPSPWVGAV